MSQGDPNRKQSEGGLKNREYLRFLGVILGALPEMERTCSNLEEEDPASAARRGVSPRARLSEALDLEKKTEEMREVVEGLRVYGEDLVDILQELDCSDTPKAREIRSNLNSVRARYSALVKSTSEVRRDLEGQVVQYDDAKGALCEVFDWLDEREKVFKTEVAARGLSLNKTVLLEQILASHNFTKELKSSEQRITDLISRCQQSGVSPNQILDATQRFTLLRSACVERDQQLEEFRRRLAQVHRAAESVHEWVRASIKKLCEGCPNFCETDSQSLGIPSYERACVRLSSPRRLLAERMSRPGSMELPDSLGKPVKSPSIGISELQNLEGVVKGDGHSVLGNSSSASIGIDKETGNKITNKKVVNINGSSTCPSIVSIQNDTLNTWGKDASKMNPVLKSEPVLQSLGGSNVDQKSLLESKLDQNFPNKTLDPSSQNLAPETPRRRHTSEEVLNARLMVDGLYADRLARLGDLDALKKSVRELAADPRVEDRGALRDLLASVQSQWNTLMDQTSRVVAAIAAVEVDDLTTFVDKAEADLEMKVGVKVDHEVMTLILEGHKQCREELYRRREGVDESVKKLQLVRRESPDNGMDVMMIRLDDTRVRLEELRKLYDNRLTQLRDLVPLIDLLIRGRDDVTTALQDVSTQLEAVTVIDSNTEVTGLDRAELVRLKMTELKCVSERLSDCRALVNEVITTGDEINGLSDRFDVSEVSEVVNQVKGHMDEVKIAVTQKQCDLDKQFKQFCSRTGDVLDSLSLSLSQLLSRFDLLESVTADPFSIRQQIIENEEFGTELEQAEVTLREVKSVVEKLKNSENKREEQSCGQGPDLHSKLSQALSMKQRLDSLHNNRTVLLSKALDISEKFFTEFLGLSEALQTIRGRLGASDPPAIEPEGVKGQQQQLEIIRKELREICSRMEACLGSSGRDLVTVSGSAGSQEVSKFTDDFDDLHDDVLEAVADRETMLVLALERAEALNTYLLAVMSWLTTAEQRLSSMPSLATTVRNIRIQIEEFKVFRVQMTTWQADIHSLNQFVTELMTASTRAHISSNSVTSPVNQPVSPVNHSAILKAQQLNDRWAELQIAADEREMLLRTGLIELGQVDHALEDVMGLLSQIESDLSKLDVIYADPRYIEVHIRKIEALLQDVLAQRPIIDQICEAVDVIVERSGSTGGSLGERKTEMTLTYSEVISGARDRRDELMDRLKEVRSFVQGVEDLVRWVREFRARELKNSRPRGAMPDTVRNQYLRVKGACEALGIKRVEVEAMLLNGEDMYVRCRDDEARLLRNKLSRLKQVIDETSERAEKIMARMEEHMNAIESFHSDLNKHTEWMKDSERRLRRLRKPSCQLETVLQQLQAVKDLRRDLGLRSEAMKQVDQTGTRLKYYGSRQDTVYLKDFLMSVRTRWKKLLQAVDSVETVLTQAHREAKRFYDSWNSLCEWLESSEVRLSTLVSEVSGSVTSTAKSKHDIDELKKLDMEMSGKYPQYCSTRRLGTRLLDSSALRVSDSDCSERQVITDMINKLITRWSHVKALLLKRTEKFELVTLTEDKTLGGVAALVTWFSKARVCLMEDGGTHGDMETVRMLLEQHGNFEQELLRRLETVDKLKASSGASGQKSSGKTSAASREELIKSADVVRAASEKRREKLNESLRLAEELSECIDQVMEWLPLAETKLKFCSIPDDENRLLQLIEDHEKFHGDLLSQEGDIDKLRGVGEGILSSPHPAVVRTIAHRISSINSRWVGVLQRSTALTEQLESALNKARRSENAQDELSSWLNTALQRLNQEQEQNLPSDVQTLNDMIEEHSRFHEELCRKLKDIDRLRRPANMSPLTLPPPSASTSLLPSTLPQSSLSLGGTGTLGVLGSAVPSVPLNSSTSSTNDSSKELQGLGEGSGRLFGARPPRPTAAASLAALSTCVAGRPGSVGSTVLALRGKWQAVWQMSSMKKRRLRDALNSLQEGSAEKEGEVTMRLNKGAGSGKTADKSADCMTKTTPDIVKDCIGAAGVGGSGVDVTKPHQLKASQTASLDSEDLDGGFEYELFRRRFADWFHSRKLRIGDVVARAGPSGGRVGGQESAGGLAVMSRKQFVNGMIAAKCPFSAADLNSVFDTFDTSHEGFVVQRDMFRTLLSEQQTLTPRPEVLSVLSDSDLIAEEMRQQLLRCQCAVQFLVERIEPGKYKFGVKGKQSLVRFVNRSVTVRVGGGWMTLEEYLDTVDPCRVRSRPSSVRSGGDFTPSSTGSLTPPTGGRATPTHRGSTDGFKSPRDHPTRQFASPAHTPLSPSVPLRHMCSAPAGSTTPTKSFTTPHSSSTDRPPRATISRAGSFKSGKPTASDSARSGKPASGDSGRTEKSAARDSVRPKVLPVQKNKQ